MQEEAVHALHLVLITSVRDLTVIVNEHRGIKQYLPGSQPGKSAVTIRNFRLLRMLCTAACGK